jgi:hypothetical protein
MDKDTQLPAEVLAGITQKAEAVYLQLDAIVTDIDCNFGLPMFEKRLGPIEEAITEYATELHAARELLEKAINSRSLHNVKNYDLLNEIKTFLDGK